MLRNTANQYFHILLFDGDGPVAGEAANIDVRLSIDDGSYVELDTSGMIEVNADDATGEYKLPLSQANTNGYKLAFSPSHATASAVGDPGNVIYTTRESAIIDTLEEIKGTGFDADDHSLDNLAQTISDLLAGSVIVRTVGPGYNATTNAFELFEGDDYLASQDPARHTDFTITARTGIIGDWSIEVGYESAAGTRVTGTASLADNGNGTWRARVEWTAAQLPNAGTYTWHLRLTDPNGKKQTIVEGDLRIKNSALEAN